MVSGLLTKGALVLSWLYEEVCSQTLIDWLASSLFWPY